MEKIINELKHYTGKFPGEALEKAVMNKSEITPLLLFALDDLLADPQMYLNDDDYMLHLYSLYLLAQFREKRAFDRIIKLITLPPDAVELLLGDVITESLPDILYSTYTGELSVLERVIENRNADLFVRGSVLDVLGKLYSDGAISEGYLVNYLRQLIAERTYDLETEEVFCSFIQGIVADHDLATMVGDIQKLYDEDRIDPTAFGDYDEFLAWMRETGDGGRVKYIDDVIAEMSWWACFDEAEANLKQQTRPQSGSFAESLAPLGQFIREGVKVGRNDPCPCGSGKKYKKCCGNN